MRAFSYDEALAALGGALKFGINPSLDGIAQLCEQLGRPQDTLSVIQVTGTNGKSSTCRFIEAIVRHEGVKTGLYTSPELERYPERMEIDGEVVSDDEFAAAIRAALEAAERARPGLHGSQAGFTEFELLTAGALWLFRERQVGCAVLEVGLGGRWDATSVVEPKVAVVTGVGLDHTAILGDTIEQIASEKAAIIRPRSAAVIGPGTEGLEDVFVERARAVGAPVTAVRASSQALPRDAADMVTFEVLEHPSSPLGETVLRIDQASGGSERLAVAAPAYQAGNIATAFAAARAWLQRSPRAMAEALREIRLPGRFEVICREPLVIVDGSHNPQASAVLVGAIADAWPHRSQRPVVVLGVLADKDARGIVEALAPVVERFIVTSPASPRALQAADLASVVQEVTGREPEVHPRLADALDAARRTARPLVVTGSLTTAGQARTALLS